MITTLISQLESLSSVQLERVQAVQEEQRCIIYKDSRKTIYIGRTEKYTYRACDVWSFCDCPYFFYNKTPCKHLMSLACWVVNQTGTGENKQ